MNARRLPPDRNDDTGDGADVRMFMRLGAAVTAVFAAGCVTSCEKRGTVVSHRCYRQRQYRHGKP